MRLHCGTRLANRFDAMQLNLRAQVAFYMHLHERAVDVVIVDIQHSNHVLADERILDRVLKFFSFLCSQH